MKDLTTDGLQKVISLLLNEMGASKEEREKVDVMLMVVLPTGGEKARFYVNTTMNPNKVSVAAEMLKDLVEKSDREGLERAELVGITHTKGGNA